MSPYCYETSLADELATVEAGKALASLVNDISGNKANVMIYLQGRLGAGKTTFSRGFIQSLGHSGAVKSPTYTLVEPYEMEAGAVYHFDLYRLQDPEELAFLGCEEYFNSCLACLVEWPEKGEGLLPEADLVVSLESDAEGRKMILEGRSVSGEQICKNFAQSGK
jgi:tRNA threonylcarbamoyladenosine biosynthesis protein TsaE